MRDRKPMWFNIRKDSVGAAWYCTMVPFLQNIDLYDICSIARLRI